MAQILETFLLQHRFLLGNGFFVSFSDGDEEQCGARRSDKEYFSSLRTTFLKFIDQQLVFLKRGKQIDETTIKSNGKCTFRKLPQNMKPTPVI